MGEIRIMLACRGIALMLVRAICHGGEQVYEVRTMSAWRGVSVVYQQLALRSQPLLFGQSWAACTMCHGGEQRFEERSSVVATVYSLPRDLFGFSCL